MPAHFSVSHYGGSDVSLVVKMMKYLMCLLLMAPLSALWAADDWWEDTTKSLPELLNDGYVIVAFSAGPDGSRVDKPGVKLRYVLMHERNRRAALCTQFEPLTTTAPVLKCMLSRD